MSLKMLMNIYQAVLNFQTQQRKEDKAFLDIQLLPVKHVARQFLKELKLQILICESKTIEYQSMKTTWDLVRIASVTYKKPFRTKSHKG